MNNKLNLLILGAGMYTIGRGTSSFGTILPALFEASNREYINNIIICCTCIKSSNEARNKFNKLSKLYKKKINVKFFPNIKNKKYNLEDIVKKFNCNSAIISIPDHLHYEYSIKLIKLKLHCLVVKPMTTKKIFAKKMIDLAKKNNVVGMVEFHKRYDEANLIIKDKIAKKELGNLEYAIIEYSQRKSIPITSFSKWVNKTNIFQYLGIHYVDLIFYLTSFKPISVLAYGQKDYLKEKNINTFDSTQIIIEWKKNNGKKFVSVHITNWIDSNKSSAMSDQTIKIIGSKGRIISDQKNRGFQLVTDQKGIEDLNPYFTSILDEDTNLSNKAFGYGIESVLKYLGLSFYFSNNRSKDVTKFMNNNKQLPSFQASYVSTVILEAANKSLENGKKEKIKL